MTINELLKNVGQLNLAEFESFFHKIQAMHSSKLPDKKIKEAKLLEKINSPFNRKKQLRFDVLIAKRDLALLTKEEYNELLSLTEDFEKYELKRLKLITKLADLKKLNLPEIVEIYNIRPLAYG